MRQGLPIWAILKAGRGRICAGLYVRQRGRWRLAPPYQLTTLAGLCEIIGEPAFVCGEIDAADGDLIRRRLGPDVTIATPAATLRRAAYLAELGWERLGRADADDVATLSPIYLKPPEG
jgi:tRNA threonylcarbamoyladenosine biosynthesis protein TsaB